MLLCLSFITGCYYAQAVRGQFEVLAKREPLDDVIADPAADAALVARLQKLRTARDFASAELLLPDNDSYRTYADLGRDHVLWNVIAAPEFSLQPETWCYVIVGCVAYRGYFAEVAARRAAARLERDGFDVYVGGVAAYSTLGRFADPILNTMLERDDLDLVALLFHELAHQRTYIRDATEFNESFASAVADIGVRRWLAAHEDDAARRRWLARRELSRNVTELLLTAANDLRALYGSELPAADMRCRKAERLGRLAADAAQLTGREGWPGGTLNNARLASLSLYRGTVGAFLALYANCADDLRCFYEGVDTLAGMPPAHRDAVLADLR